MSITGCLFRMWATLSVLAVALAIACFWLVEHLPAAQSANEATIYLTTFLISALAPMLLVPVLAMVGVTWAVLRALLRLAQRSRRLDRLAAARPRFSAPRHGRA